MKMIYHIDISKLIQIVIIFIKKNNMKKYSHISLVSYKFKFIIHSFIIVFTFAVLQGANIGF